MSLRRGTALSFFKSYESAHAGTATILAVKSSTRCLGDEPHGMLPMCYLKCLSTTPLAYVITFQLHAVMDIRKQCTIKAYLHPGSLQLSDSCNHLLGRGGPPKVETCAHESTM